MRIRSSALFLVLVPGAFADEMPFVDVSKKALPGVSTTCGSNEKDWILEVNGGGVVLGDFNRDGNVDVVLVDGSTLERAKEGKPGFPPRLFFGKGDGTFTTAGDAWAVGGGRFGMGGTAGDVNGDGWLDLVVTQWGPDRLFLNDEGKGFVEATETSGLSGERWGTSAAFLDFNADGVLDLVVVNYLAFRPGEIAPRGSGGCQWKGHDVMCGPEGLIPVHDQLYRGKGDGTFEEVSAEAGFRPEVAGFGLGVMTLDYDADGDTDIYVTNDSTPNHLWENQGDGTFKEVGYYRGVSHDGNGKEQAGMGIACGDVNADGRPDLFVTNFSGESNAFYRSRRRGFREVSDSTRLSGPSRIRLGWGTGLHDFDLDADLDLFVLNGHVYPQADAPGTDTSYAQPDQFFENDGEGRFAAKALSAAPDAVSRAGAAADIDNDGDLDLIVLRVEGPVQVLLNTADSSKRRWLRVQLAGRGKNAQGIGAQVTARWKGGSQVSEVRTTGGFQAGVPAEVHFGLGTASKLDELVVRWPSGTVQTLEDVALDRVLVVEEPE